MARGPDRSRAWPGRTTPRRAPLKDLIGLEDLSFCELGNGEPQISAGDLLSAGAFAADVCGICVEAAHARAEARQIISQWPQPGGSHSRGVRAPGDDAIMLPRAFGTLAVEAGMKRHLTRWCLARAERSYRRLHNRRETLPNRPYCRSANQPLALKSTRKRCGTYVAAR